VSSSERFGDILRQQRESKGITLEQAAADTRIREKFLGALETGDHHSLPGAVYTKGFLRNYAEYLDLNGADLVALYASERAVTPEPPRQIRAMKPVMRSGMYISPTIFVPVVVLAAVVLFVGYISYQFATFATPPRIEVTDPSGDVIAQSGEYVVHGKTTPGFRVTVKVGPSLESYDVPLDPDGSFAVKVRLSQGTNHIDVQVLDAAGKVSLISRRVIFDAAAAATQIVEPLPQALVEQPAQNGTYTNSSVPVAGRVEKSITTLLVNGQPLAIGSDGRFSGSINYPAGTHAVRFVARTAGGAESTETRTVTVSFTAAVVTVIVAGGDAWLLAQVDGTQPLGTGRVLASGTSQTFTGKQVTIRTGNAGATQVIYNGQLQGALGTAGQVVEKTFTFQ
jgi:transcriptional regulator with XRE-family HTH domain